MGRDLLLTFDVGTTAVKSILWDDSITPLSVHREEYTLTTRDERVEVPPQLYRELIRRGCRQVLADVDARRVAAICLTTQGETLIRVDGAGRALGPAIVWLDHRGASQAADLRQRLDPDVFYRHSGLPYLDGTAPLAKAAGLAAELAGVAEPRLLLLEDYLVHWLTGRMVATRSLHTSTGWFDLESDDYWDEALAAAGLDRRLLPELMDSGQPVGELLPQVASELGLDPHVVVVSGAMDQSAAAIGTGLSEPGIVAASFGTALVVTALLPGPVEDPAHRPTVYRHALPGMSLGILFAATSGALLRWLRSLLGERETDRLSYAELDALAAAVAPGSGGLLALPFFESGDGEAPGALIGLSLGAGRGQVARSLLEGTSFALRDLLTTLDALGTPATELRTSGGGSRSSLWQSIAADVCRVPVTPLPFGEAASAGAALLGAWGAGLLPHGVDPRPLDRGETFHPSGHDPYAAHYRRYRQALAALRPLRSPTADPELSSGGTS